MNQNDDYHSGILYFFPLRAHSSSRVNVICLKVRELQTTSGAAGSSAAAFVSVIPSALLALKFLNAVPLPLQCIRATCAAQRVVNYSCKWSLRALPLISPRAPTALWFVQFHRKMLCVEITFCFVSLRNTSKRRSSLVTVLPVVSFA